MFWLQEAYDLNSKYKGSGEGTLLLDCGSWIMAMTELIPSAYGPGFVFAVRPQEDEAVYPALCTHTEHSYTAKTTTAFKSLFKMPFLNHQLLRKLKKERKK